MPRRRAPRLGGLNKFEQGWVDLLLGSHLDGFKALDACLYLSQQTNTSGRKYSRIPNQFRMNTILKKSRKFRRHDEGLNSGIRWWRIGGEEE